MNQHNEEPIHVSGDVAALHEEKAGQAFLVGQREETAERCSSQAGTSSSPPASPRQTEGKVVKQKAKKTSRLRLIEQLNRANGITRAVQPAVKVMSETLESNTLPVNCEHSAPEGSASIAEATASTVPGSDTQGPSPKADMAPQTPAPYAIPAEWDLRLRMDGQNFYLVNKVAYAPSKPIEERRKSQIQSFDSAAFDAAIYGQPAAMKHPPKVYIPARTRRSSPSSSEDQRLYLHLDPAIHYAHNRSDDWFSSKAQEIESRGGRKAWFGKAIERVQWLRAQAVREKRLANGHGLSQRRVDPQPWKHSRPVDFGDVPESQLPDDILQNPNWLRFCAHFRETERIRMLRHREAKKSKQETQEFYKNVMAGMRTSTGR